MRQLEDSKEEMSQVSVQVATHPEMTLACVKTAILEERKQGVVYKVPSRGCGAMYISETGRHLQERVKNMLSSNKMTSVLISHNDLARSEGEVEGT